MALEELNTSENRKRASRREIKTAVTALDRGYTKEAGLQVSRYVVSLPEYEQAGIPFCFVGTSSEIDAAPILENALRRGKRVGVPRCTSRGIMEVCEIRSFRDLEAGKYGIMESGAHAPVVQAEKINLAIVPCTSYSRNGRQLGYGGEYYDRYLGRTQAVKAVVRGEWIIRADIPVEPHDQTIDMVISGKGVRRLMDQ